MRTKCWPFEGYINKQGYGRIWHEGRNDYAHRVAYMLAIGPIPEGHGVHHLCGNRACIRPEHLEARVSHVGYRGRPIEDRLWRGRHH